MPKVGQKVDQDSEPNRRLAISDVQGPQSNAVEQVARAFDPGPDVRLALGAAGSDTCYKEDGAISKALDPPSVRLATLGPPEAIAQGLGPDERLAHKVNYQGDRTLEEGGRKNDPRLPALLVSYVYLRQFLENRHRYHYRDWVMDSGAFSAFNSGTEIRLQDYIDCCKKLLAEDPTLTEVFALDVVGDEKASLRNTEEMWRQGVPAIPCFHYGEPWEMLTKLCKAYPKVAIGGCVGKKDKDQFAGQCFARAWPKKFHGFGFGSEKSIMMFPWHSTDATNWEIAPCRYGHWKAFGGAKVSVRGSQQNLRAEVEWYLDLEQRARQRWKKEMELLSSIDTLSVRHKANAHAGRQDAKNTAFGGVRLDGEPNAANGQRIEMVLAPSVRLVGQADDVTDRRKVAFADPDGEEK